MSIEMSTKTVLDDIQELLVTVGRQKVIGQAGSLIALVISSGTFAH